MDIDIDLKPDFKVERVFKDVVLASIVEKEELKRHLVGAHFQDIPKDTITGLSAIPYQEAQEIGYMKIDFLSLNLLSCFETKAEVRHLAKKEPNWQLLEDEEFVGKLFHISKHYEVVRKVKPKSILEIADVLAIIRPNKRHLLDKYLKNREAVRKELYKKRDASDLRKSHAIAYAVNVVINIHLLEAGIL